MLVATEHLRAELVQRGFANAARWCRGADARLFDPSKRADLGLPRPVHLIVGRLAPEKDPQAFLALELPVFPSRTDTFGLGRELRREPRSPAVHRALERRRRHLRARSRGPLERRAHHLRALPGGAPTENLVRRLIALLAEQPMRTPASLALAALLAHSLASPRHAQGAEPQARIAREVGDDARASLSDPTLRERVGAAPVRGRWARLLEDAGLKLRAAERNSRGELALGFAFDLAKAVAPAGEGRRHALELAARGQVVLERAANPDDHLEGGLRMRWTGTHTLGSAPEGRREHARGLADPDGETLAAIDAEALARLSRRLDSLSDDELRLDADFRTLSAGHAENVRRTLPSELDWDWDLHAGLESDQGFSSRQVVLGASVGGHFISWDPDAAASRLNPFDAPAAALRWLAGEDEEFRTSGDAYPTIALGLDIVDASRDGTRSAVTDDESFLRARLDARLASSAFTLGEEALMLTAAWRVYQEIDAPASVRRADIDVRRHLEIELELIRGWSLSYSTGTLPLDPHPDSTFALGFALEL
jgi:hypothetical protein